MAKISAVEIPSLLMDDQGSDPSTPAAGLSRVYTKSDGLYIIDDAGGITGPFAEASGGATYAGNTLWAPPVGFLGETTATSALTADSAYMMVVNIGAPMYVRALDLRVSTSAAGTVQWGLFNAAGTPTAAVKVAGGSGTTGGTGWRQIAASGAPVLIDPGSYFLIYKQPAATPPTVFRTLISSSHNANFAWVQASYTWDDTPNMTTGWTDNTTVINCGIVGDINASTQLP